MSVPYSKASPYLCVDSCLKCPTEDIAVDDVTTSPSSTSITVSNTKKWVGAKITVKFKSLVSGAVANELPVDLSTVPQTTDGDVLLTSTLILDGRNAAFQVTLELPSGCRTSASYLVITA